MVVEVRFCLGARERFEPADLALGGPLRVPLYPCPLARQGRSPFAVSARPGDDRCRATRISDAA
jgi:hypothetical protein